MKTLLLCLLALLLVAPARAQESPLIPPERAIITPENAAQLTLFADLEMPHGMMAMSSGTELTFTPNGRKLVASRVWQLGQDEHIRIWDIPSGELLHAVDREPARVNNRLQLSPDGLAMMSIVFEDGFRLGLLDIESGQERRWNFVFPSNDAACEVHTSVSGLTYTPDGTLVAYGFDDCINAYVVWNPRSGDIVTSVPMEQGQIVPLTGGGLLLMQTQGMGFRLENLLSGALVFASDGSQGLGNYVGVSRDESLIAYSYDVYPAEIAVFAQSESTPRYRVTFEDDVHRVLFSPDNRLMISTSSSYVRVWNADTGDLLATLDNQMAGDVAFSPDGTLMAVGGLLDVVRVWGVPA